MSYLKEIVKRILGRSVDSTLVDPSTTPFYGLKSIGYGVEFDGPVQIDFRDRVSIGNYVYVGPRVQLYGRGSLEIQDHVIIGPEVVILTSMHNHRNATMVPYDEVELLRPVTIERCSWIGIRAILLPGVTVGEGSIIGAGAVVAKSCSPGSILGGNPAQRIGQRDMKHYWSCVNDERFYLMLKKKYRLSKRELYDTIKS